MSNADRELASLIHNPERLEARLKELPGESGVYLMRDRQDDILYIGKSKKLRSRGYVLTFALLNP